MSDVRSMTGFGRSSASGEGCGVEVEIKSWNAKGFDAQIRLPDAYVHLEAPLREELAGRAARGKIIAAIRLRGDLPGREIVFHEPLVKAVFLPYREIARQLGVEPRLSAGDLLHLPGAVEIHETAQGAIEELIRGAFRDAVAAWDASRLREGARMEEAIREQAEALSRAALAIKNRQDAAPLERAARMRARVAELVQHLSAGAHDEKRLELEIALLAEKSDVKEELVRLEAHLASLQKLLGGGKPTGPKPRPIGAELGFVLQELLRETNTTGSKTADIETVKAVIAAKTAIDRIKEIAANVV